ncbi:D-glycero-alpha-D-manno-heptose-1,7-bisphosphate 7-phosphatase [Bacillus sp. SCS-153A]|uniref:D-glycero-alpha-D-manno-heptose-1,7-bisphosphate 7-phosphatase n=1 Tax=Rossellomorea sedimentorum TaxID=3115294 RepID=UPI003906B7BB
MIAVFLDRDGTIGGTGGGMHPFEFSMYEFTPKAIKLLNDLGVKVFLFTNQTRVGRGYFTEEELLEGFRRLENELANHSAFLDDIYYCPHKPDDGCLCQKPKTGLLADAEKEYNLELDQCYIVGDTGSSDMIAAEAVGAKKILVKTGWGSASLTTHRDTWEGVEPDAVTADLMGAVEWIANDVMSNK